MGMMKLGEKQELVLRKRVDFGVYLAALEDRDRDFAQIEKVLLPIKQVPQDSSVGDILEVFVYRDSKDRLIATTNTPFLMLHEVGVLKVKEVSKIGAFLDWGLEKDLLLPLHSRHAES